MNDWKFNGVMNCDKCKFNHQCNMEPDCPYLAGWEDGQKKLLAYMVANAETGAHLTKNMMRDALKELEGKNEKTIK